MNINKLFFSKIDIAPVAFFRIVLGFFLLVESIRFLFSGRIFYYWIGPKFKFTYIFFDWIKPLPGDGMYYLWAFLGLIAIAFMFGFYYRIASVLMFLIWTWGWMIEKAFYNNHYYFVSLLCFAMIFIPAHRYCSLDAKRNPELESQTIDSWTLWLIKFHVFLPYFFGGVVKINYDWLHGEPLRTWMKTAEGIPVIENLFVQEWFIHFVAYAGMLLDLLIVPAMIYKPTRKIAFIIITCFHLTNSMAFHIGIFPWLMILATALFFEPESIRKQFFSNKKALKEIKLVQGPKYLSSLILIYVVIHCLLPMRIWLYPGHPEWHMQTRSFAWRMKASTTFCLAHFYARTPDGVNEWKIDNANFISRNQYDVLAASPRMMVQYAHYLDGLYQKVGYHNMIINVDAKCSLNGRPMKTKVDPKVNLAQEPIKLGHYDWILPLKTELQR